MTRDAVIRYRLILSRKNDDITDFKTFRTSSFSNGLFRFSSIEDEPPYKKNQLRKWFETKNGTVKKPTTRQKYCEILYQFLKRNFFVLAASVITCLLITFITFCKLKITGLCWQNLYNLLSRLLSNRPVQINITVSW